MAWASWYCLSLPWVCFSPFSRPFSTTADLLPRCNLFGYRNFPSVRPEWYLAGGWTDTPEGGCDWRDQRDCMGLDVDAVLKICEYTLPSVQRLRLNARPRSLSPCASVPERGREEVSPCSRGCILLLTRTMTATGS